MNLIMFKCIPVHDFQDRPVEIVAVVRTSLFNMCRPLYHTKGRPAGREPQVRSLASIGVMVCGNSVGKVGLQILQLPSTTKNRETLLFVQKKERDAGTEGERDNCQFVTSFISMVVK